MNSYRPEVLVAGQWAGNALRFATKEEAEQQVQDLALRWTLVMDTRVVESEDKVNYIWKDGNLIPKET